MNRKRLRNKLKSIAAAKQVEKTVEFVKPEEKPTMPGLEELQELFGSGLIIYTEDCLPYLKEVEEYKKAHPGEL